MRILQDQIHYIGFIPPISNINPVFLEGLLRRLLKGILLSSVLLSSADIPKLSYHCKGSLANLFLGESIQYLVCELR